MESGAINQLLRGWYYYRAGLWTSLWTLNNFLLMDMGWGTRNAANGATVIGWLVYWYVKRRRRKRPLRNVLMEASAEEIRMKGASVFFSWLLYAAFWVKVLGVNSDAFVYLLVHVLTPFFVVFTLGLVGGRRFNHKLRTAVADEATETPPSDDG